MSVNSTNGSRKTRPSTTTVVAMVNEEIVTMVDRVDRVDTAVVFMAATTTITNSNTRQPRKAHPDRPPLQHPPPVLVLVLVLLLAQLTTVRNTPNTTEPTRTLHMAVTRIMSPIINITNSTLNSNRNSSNNRKVLLHSRLRRLAKLPRLRRQAPALPLPLRLEVAVTAL